MDLYSSNSRRTLITETRVSCTMLWLATDPKLRPSRPSVFRVSDVSTLAHLEYASSGHQKPDCVAVTKQLKHETPYAGERTR